MQICLNSKALEYYADVCINSMNFDLIFFYSLSLHAKWIIIIRQTFVRIRTHKMCT